MFSGPWLVAHILYSSHHSNSCDNKSDGRVFKCDFIYAFCLRQFSSNGFHLGGSFNIIRRNDYKWNWYLHNAIFVDLAVRASADVCVCCYSARCCISLFINKMFVFFFVDLQEKNGYFVASIWFLCVHANESQHPTYAKRIIIWCCFMCVHFFSVSYLLVAVLFRLQNLHKNKISLMRKEKRILSGIANEMRNTRTDNATTSAHRKHQQNMTNSKALTISHNYYC